MVVCSGRFELYWLGARLQFEPFDRIIRNTVSDV
jgi:hypothetical protein